MRKKTICILSLVYIFSTYAYAQDWRDIMGQSTIETMSDVQTARKRLYFRDFKERLVHFNGTVVN